MDNRVFQVGASATPPSPPASPSNGYPTNGDPVTSTPATQPGEFWFYQIGEELRAILIAAGVVPSTGNSAQVVEAIQRLIDAQSGNYALDTGAANAYVVALSPAIIAYANGMTIRVKAVNANTGACTINAGGGVVALDNDVGAALVGGDIPAGGVFTATYVASAGAFYMNALVQSQGDTRYAAIAQTFYIGTTQIAVNRASGAITLNGVSIDGAAGSAATAGTATNQSGGTVNATTGAFSSLISANGGQIKFPATQNASADANTLDDYEEGTFTPSYGNGSVTYTLQTGSYIKVGGMFTFSLNLTWTNSTGHTGNPYVGGMPFSLKSGAGIPTSIACVIDHAGWTVNAAGSMLSANLVSSGSTIIYLFETNTLSAHISASYDISATLLISGSYPVN